LQNPLNPSVPPIDQDDAEFFFGQTDIGDNLSTGRSLRQFPLLNLKAIDPEHRKELDRYFHGLRLLPLWVAPGGSGQKNPGVARSLSDLGNPSENLAERGQILSILKVNSRSIDQESGEI
jgi:hypothetical protein